MTYSRTDFAALARAHGCAGLRVDAPDQLGPALREAVALGRPVVVDVTIDREAYHAMLPHGNSY